MAAVFSKTAFSQTAFNQSAFNFGITAPDIFFPITYRDDIQPGINSFASYGQLLVIAQDHYELSALHSATEEDSRKAFKEAWTNLGNFKVRFRRQAGYLSKFTSQDLDELKFSDREVLIRAQVIEANFVLGGDPTAQRINTGLVSTSSGESTQYLRSTTTKGTAPLRLAASREALEALKGHIVWTVKSGR